VYDRNAGGIVTAIFEPPQTVQKYGRRLCAADISDNSTHNFRKGIIAYFPPIALCPRLVDEHARPSSRVARTTAYARGFSEHIKNLRAANPVFDHISAMQ